MMKWKTQCQMFIMPGVRIIDVTLQREKIIDKSLKFL